MKKYEGFKESLCEILFLLCYRFKPCGCAEKGAYNFQTIFLFMYLQSNGQGPDKKLKITAR